MEGMMTTEQAAATASRSAGTLRRWCRTGKVTATKTNGRWAIDPTTLPNYQKQPVTTPIIIAGIDGLPVAAGPATTIRTALRGATPLTITGTRATGDTIWLAPRTRQTWHDDAISINRSDIARTVQHPDHGEIVYAWIDTSRLDQAPQVAAIVANYQHRVGNAAMAAEDRARRMVPACDNCGNCSQCI